MGWVLSLCKEVLKILGVTQNRPCNMTFVGDAEIFLQIEEHKHIRGIHSSDTDEFLFLLQMVYMPRPVLMREVMRGSYTPESRHELKMLVKPA